MPVSNVMKKLLGALRYFITHWIPNLVLVAGSIFLIQIGLPVLAFLLIAISKWQVLRGGRKIWLHNLRDNACDLVVAFSSLGLMVLLQEDLWLQLLTGATYYLWLVFIKPRSGPLWMALQAGICQLAGLSLVFLLGRTLPEILIISMAWVVGVVAADHLLVAHQESAHNIIVFSWGLVVAQFAWLFWRWLIFYSLLDERILVPQAALVITIFGYTFANIYLDHARKRLGRVRLAEYILLCAGLFIAIIIGTQWDTRL